MDREKLVRAWEIFRDSNPYEICNGREFRAFAEPEYCMSQMIEDTIAMLKEQEEVSVDVCGQMFTVKYGHCPKCNEGLNSEVYPHWCGFCGQAVKWDE